VSGPVELSLLAEADVPAVSGVVWSPDWTLSVSPAAAFADGEITMQELFVFNQTGVTPDGRAVGYHTATGAKSAFLKHFRSNGVNLPDSLFQPATLPPASRES